MDFWAKGFYHEFASKCLPATVEDLWKIMTDTSPSGDTLQAKPLGSSLAEPLAKTTAPVVETGGPKGLEPTRYGDWERKGRCIDF